MCQIRWWRFNSRSVSEKSSTSDIWFKFAFSKEMVTVCWNKLQGDPRKCAKLYFWITSKVVKIEPSYWLEKKPNLIGIFLISMFWKSNHWYTHNALISKSSQNADKIKNMAFKNNSNYFRDLLSENVHIITKWMS